MLSLFQWICLLSILAVTFAGGYFPLFHPDKARDTQSIPFGEAFTSGVFLALAATLMLPSSLHILSVSFPHFDYPLGAFIAIIAFMALLALEHKVELLRQSMASAEGERSPAIIPVIMTTMIAIPSFFLGTAFGASETDAALLIFVAIMIHKSSAAFALALTMVRSTMSHGQVWITFCMFAFATPLGILVGEQLHSWLGMGTMVIVKGIILGLAAGTFLYMATLHGFRHAPMITICSSRKGFSIMLAGFLLTTFVRLLLGEAHKIV
jgi:zinc transporter ZupT